MKMPDRSYNTSELEPRREGRSLEMSCRASSAGEQGWALLGLILALSILSIALVSAVVPNVQFQVRRDKEIEMMYRGKQMAEGIARYYGRGRLASLQLAVPPPYGYLTELKKLKEGVTMGVTELKFVRPSAIIDPMTGEEWEPVRARDPRIMTVLQAYSAENQVPIPASYLMIASAPVKTHVFEPTTPPQAAPGAQSPDPQQEGAPGQPPQIVPAPNRPTGDEEEDDDDDDDDDDDPLGHLFQPGQGNSPIIGVAPKLKGPSVRSLYGLRNYEEWVFIYVPPANLLRPGMRVNPNQPPNGGDRPQVSP